MTNIEAGLQGPRTHVELTSRTQTIKEMLYLPVGATKEAKTYNRRDSHVVTDHSTSLPVRGLSTGERTGSSVFRDLWSYVLIPLAKLNILH